MPIDKDFLGYLLTGVGQGLQNLSTLQQKRVEQEAEASAALAKEMRGYKVRFAADDRRREDAAATRRAATDKDLLNRSLRLESEQRVERRGERTYRRRQEEAETKRLQAFDEKNVARRQSEDYRYQQWLQGKYEPATAREKIAFETKAGLRGRPGAVKAGDKKKGQISRADLFDKWTDVIIRGAGESEFAMKVYGVKTFAELVEKWPELTGQKVVDGSTEEPDEEADAPISKTATASNAIPVPQLGSSVDLYNHILSTRGQFIPFDPTAQPEDFEPASELPPLPGQTGGNEIDITSAVDPSFDLDPTKSDAAAFAESLFDRTESGEELSDEEMAWLEQYLEAVGL